MRAEGWDAARAGLAEESSPYAVAGGWRAAEWLIGHLGFGGSRPAALMHAAKVARRREGRRRARELLALANPPRPKRRSPARPAYAGTCKRGACGKPIPWDPKRSAAKNRRRDYCCAECARIVQHEAAVARREELWRTDPQAARALERKTRRTLGVSRPEGDRDEPPPIPRPAPVTELMWRAACEYLDPVVMRRFMALDETQVARVLELQRRGARGPRVAGSAAA